MPCPRSDWLAAQVALAIIVAGSNAHATPLIDDGSTRGAAEAQPARRLTDAEIVGSGSVRSESGMVSPSLPEGTIQRYLENTSGDPGGQWLQDRTQGFQYGTSTGSPLEIFRSLVNVPKGNAARNAPRRPGEPPEPDLLGPEAREWIDDTVRGIVNSAVELKVNDQGRTTFSVMGMGDFGVMMSADRNEVALVSGDDVLLTANRLPPAAAAVGGAYGGEPGASGQSGAAAGPASGTTLQQAIELATEVATHPLSILVYAIVGGFLILWNIMTAQTRRPPAPQHYRTDDAIPRTRRSHRQHRSRSARRH